jgi:SAM-dependent methyltransferase
VILLQSLYRVSNGLRKIAAGLRPFSESVWPGVRNDLFVAHQSIYEFFSLHVGSRSVLDAGCGTGYGSFRLASAGATSVLGVDIDPRNIRFARRRYILPNLAFDVADIEHLDAGDALFDVVVSSNVIEHLGDPFAFLTCLRRLLRPRGFALLAVPPIHTSHDAEAHAQIRYHRSNLSVSEWADLMQRAGFVLSGYSHRMRGSVLPDLTSHLPSRLSVEDFTFATTTPEALCSEATITAVFHLRPTD